MPETMVRADLAGSMELRDAETEGDGRSISGTAVPYNEPVRGATREFGNAIETFAHGAFRDVVAEVASGRRIPIIDAHDGTPVGYASELEDTPAGLIYRGRLLATAAARDFAEQVAARVMGVSIEFLPGEVRRATNAVTHTRVRMLGAIAGSYRPGYAGATANVRDMEANRMPDPNPTPEPTTEPTPEPTPTITTEQVSGIARQIARIELTEARRAWSEEAAGGQTDAWQSLRSYRSIGDLMLAIVNDPENTDLRGSYSRALLDQITTDNPGVTTPGIVGDVKGIVNLTRASISAIGTEPLSSSGMDVLWPFFDGTLSALVGVQTLEKTPVTSVLVSLKKGTEPLVTYAGGSDISYQLIRRSSPSYLDAYGRIMLAAWALVTDNAFADKLSTAGTGTVAIGSPLATATETELRAAMLNASLDVQAATGQPASVILASTSFFSKVGSTLIRLNVLELQDTPRIVHEPNLAADTAIATNALAATWHEDGPFQATAEDVEKLGRNVAFWSMGAGAVYIPAGVVVIS
jgi:phage head maturation protease